MQSDVGKSVLEPKKPPRVPRGGVSTGVPEEILQDQVLVRDVAALPSNYNFELFKTVWRVRRAGAKKVALQMPEGLLMYASVIGDVLKKHCNGPDVIVLGDVTYGACCVDDFSASALGCDFLVHYGHSCLVPVQSCKIPMLYVFVEIHFDPKHLLDCIREEFEKGTKLALLGTIQFVATIQALKSELIDDFLEIIVPKARPLSPGELLGCTAPQLGDVDVLVYIADGRFHLESVMIANPTVKAYKYDPYSKAFTVEEYGHELMMRNRLSTIVNAKSAKRFGVILGTLGRQGSLAIVNRIKAALNAAEKEYMVVLLSELQPAKLKLMEGRVEAWIQIACPRLSIDWGMAFSKPLLTPYEAYVALGKVEWRSQYPMDYYAKGGGEWSNYFKPESETVKPSRTIREGVK
ncbi:hypothetical protein NDN08_004795 [Rhodosorus marinus]|uniref:2-(3-amino-3-carboxypropyl)histidine synthase subunit 1 n=1 Tax=Rhodosorus marinus TaxID=101924 RepID=A0AAV8UM98_9RHOD|nr:hypothetical protein NDN08_004795 [Rhodosorus marinus]